MAATGRDLLGRLADLGEGAIQRLPDVPGGERVFGALNSLRDQLGELQKRVRRLEELERRLGALEKKVDRLAKASGAAPARRGSSARTPRSSSPKQD